MRLGRRRGATGKPIRALVNLGIGGSDLGPRLVCEALPAARRDIGPVRASRSSRTSIPAQLTRALAPLDPATTLFVVTSKTFTTQETLANAHAARAWLASRARRGVDVGAHFVAVTANVEAARAFGVAGDDVLPMWDWVGGRYSLWSAVGLPIAIRSAGTHSPSCSPAPPAMDAHFRATPLDAQPSGRARRSLGWWNAGALGHRQRIVVPYAQALARAARLPAAACRSKATASA